MSVPKKIVDQSNEKEKIINCKKEIENLYPLAMTRRIMSFLGALPCSSKSPYWPCLDRKKSNIFYCGIVYSTVTSLVLWSTVAKKQEHDSLDLSEHAMRSMSIVKVLMMVPHIIGVFIWMDAPEMASFMNLFRNFQDKFGKTTGKTIENRKLVFEKLMGVTPVFYVPCFYYGCCALVTALDKHPAMAISIIYGNLISLYIALYWNFSSMCIGDGMEAVQRELQQHLLKGDLTSHFVFEIRLMWISLRDACDSMSRLHSPSFGYSFCMLLSIILIYNGLTLLQADEVEAAAGHLLVGCIYSAIILLSGRASHEVEEKMKCLVKDILPNIALSSYDRGVQREIVMLYLVESARPSMTYFRGLIIVNKHLLLSYLSSVSTYIIVLVQFIGNNNSIA